jgi:DNA-binding GntR family transcriptional regulator
MKQLFKKLVEECPMESTVKLVYKCLHKQIISLDLHPGSKINLSKISEELNVSRTTVRDAALMLSNTGLVEIRTNQGFFVSRLNTKEMNEIYTSRAIIETGAAQVLCEIITEEQITFFYNILNDMNLSIQNNDLREFARLDGLFHKSIIDFCGNKFIINMYGKIWDTMERYISYATYLEISELMQLFSQHKVIVHSLEHSLIKNIELIIDKHCIYAQQILLHPEFILSKQHYR